MRFKLRWFCWVRVGYNGVSGDRFEIITVLVGCVEVGYVAFLYGVVGDVKVLRVRFGGVLEFTGAEVDFVDGFHVNMVNYCIRCIYGSFTALFTRNVLYIIILYIFVNSK